MILFYVILLLVFTTGEGTTLDCTQSDTLYTKTGNSAVFYVDATYAIYFHKIDFYNTTDMSQRIFGAWLDNPRLIRFDKITFYVPFLKNRITLHSKGMLFEEIYISIELKNIGLTDNGTYALVFDYGSAYCWTLFVLDIRSQNKGRLTPEGSTAIFEGIPHVSLVKALRLNATFTWLLRGRYNNQTTVYHVEGDTMKIPIVTRDMEGWNVTYRCLEDSGEVLELNKTLRVIYMIALIKNQLIEEGSAVFFQVHPSRHTTTNLTLNHVWLFDGYNLTQTSRYQFLEQEDKIWIPFVSRDMDGKNVTYRSIESNGVINEINSTVRVSYGPNWPVYLTPNRRTYQKREGDIVPEITCNVDCSPPCNLSWGIHSRDNILKLKQVTKETEGEYTCTARRVGTDNTVNETIYVYVQEETPSLFTVPIAVLAGIQALSMLFICFLLVSVLRSKKARLWKLCCQTCQSKEKSRQTDGSPGDKSLSNECQMSPLSNEAYEDLRTETRDGTMENYNNVELCEVYVNTTVDAHGHL